MHLLVVWPVSPLRQHRTTAPRLPSSSLCCSLALAMAALASDVSCSAIANKLVISWATDCSLFLILKPWPWSSCSVRLLRRWWKLSTTLLVNWPMQCTLPAPRRPTWKRKKADVQQKKKVDREKTAGKKPANLKKALANAGAEVSLHIRGENDSPAAFLRLSRVFSDTYKLEKKTKVKKKKNKERGKLPTFFLLVMSAHLWLSSRPGFKVSYQNSRSHRPLTC